MKSLILIVLTCTVINNSYAQKAGKLEWLLKAGMSNAHYRDLDFSRRGNVTGIDAGLLTNICLSKSFAVQTGISLKAAGGKTEIIQPVFQWESSTTRALYLELPLTLVYKLCVAKTFALYGGAGPYFSKGVTGKNKYNGTLGDLVSHSYSGAKTIRYEKKEESSIINYNTLASFDYGLNFLAGLGYKNISLYFNYGLGLKDVHPKGIAENMGKNTSITAGVAYRFHL